MNRVYRYGCCLALALGLALPPFPAGAAAAGYFPWTCRKNPVTGGSQPSDPRHELQGEWISTFDPQRVLDLRGGSFSLQGTGGNLAGSVVETGPSLAFTDREGNACSVLWQLLGDGRLAINSGEDLYHRRGEPAVPTVVVRQYGSEDCRFTVTIPGRLPVEEVEDGVRIISMEKDAAMQILSGRPDVAPDKLARAICSELRGTDFRAVGDGKDAFMFTASPRGVDMLQYVAIENGQYLHISLMGNYASLMSYLRQVKVVPPADLIPR